MSNEDAGPLPESPMNNFQVEENHPICGSKFCASRKIHLSPVQVSHCMGVHAQTTPPHVMSQIPSCTSLRGSNWTYGRHGKTASGKQIWMTKRLMGSTWRIQRCQCIHELLNTMMIELRITFALGLIFAWWIRISHGSQKR